MRLIIDAFDELVLHHKMCIFSFSELLTWIKGRFDCIWKAWKVNEVDWGPNPSIPNVLHLDTTSLLVQGKKEIKSNTFWGWIRTPGQLQLVMFTTVAYGLGLGRSSTLWNPYEVYFHMDLESNPYLFWGGCNDRITTRRFSVQRCCVALVWSNGPCIKSGPLGTRPRVGTRPQHPGGRPSTFIYPLAASKNSWVLFCWKFSHCYFLVDACVD